MLWETPPAIKKPDWTYPATNEYRHRYGEKGGKGRGGEGRDCVCYGRGAFSLT